MIVKKYICVANTRKS